MSKKNKNKHRQVSPAEQEAQQVYAAPAAPETPAQVVGPELLLESYDRIKSDLQKLTERIHQDLAELTAREGKLAKRELDVIEREQKVDAGFADQAKTLMDEAARQHQANQTEAERLRNAPTPLLKSGKNLKPLKPSWSSVSRSSSPSSKSVTRASPMNALP